MSSDPTQQSWIGTAAFVVVVALFACVGGLTVRALVDSDGGQTPVSKIPAELRTFTVVMPGSGDSVECVAWPDADTAPSMWCQVYRESTG